MRRQKDSESWEHAEVKQFSLPGDGGRQVAPNISSILLLWKLRVREGQDLLEVT